jgi:branched-subunit amino acid aminotransferase/4-amino-4-deoxychorismate lyase
MEDADTVIFDGKIIPAGRAVAPAVSRGLMYGDGVFETLRTYSGHSLFLEKHFERLHKGLQVLGIPKSNLPDIYQYQQLIYKLLKDQNLLKNDAVVRIQVWRDGQRGYHPDENSEPHFSITASKCPNSFSSPQLVTVNQRRIPDQALPSDCKFTNGINYILASKEAAAKGGDDALMQTTEGWVSETTIANIFWTKDDRIFTPSTECDLIPGITRNIVIDIIENGNRYEIIEGEFELEHLLSADMVWVCNSVREILPVQKIDDHLFNTEHELLNGFMDQFQAVRDRNLKPLDA